MNLVDNAVKFTDSGTVQVRLAAQVDGRARAAIRPLRLHKPRRPAKCRPPPPSPSR